MVKRATHLYLDWLARAGAAPFELTGGSAVPGAVVVVTPKV